MIALYELVIHPLTALFLGAVITWIVARLYYKKAADDLREAGNYLRDEAKELQRLTKMVLRAMEIADLVKINRDESGKPIGVIISLNVEPGEYKINGL